MIFSFQISKTLLGNSLTFSSDVINGKLENAKKENEFVYHEKVPDFDSLPELRGASLVKGIGFEITDPEISGPDIFGRLVPLEAHEASSLYRLGSSSTSMILKWGEAAKHSGSAHPSHLAALGSNPGSGKKSRCCQVN